jgi:Cu(I)/Ag(I) efflux system membrane fusion protein
MNPTTKTIIIGILALGIGLVIGKFLLGNTVQADEHSHTETGSSDNEIYTCSMHPQVRQNEPGLCPICEMDLILLDNGGGVNQDPTVLKMTPEAAKLAQVETTLVGKTGSANNNSMTKAEGIVRIDQSLTNVQTAHISGRIENIMVRYAGEYVKSGQLIASIYSPGLLAASQELLTAEKNEEKFPGLKEAAIQKIKNWKITMDQINDVLKSGVPLQQVNVFSDHSGYITDIYVAPGDYLKEGEVLFKLANTSNLWIEFNVFESDLGGIRKGQKIEFTTPSEGNKTFKATVSFIDPILDEKSRTVVVRASVNNPGNRLKPGMLVSGTINSSAAANSSAGVLVPRSSVLWTGPRSVVYVKIPDDDIPSFQYREVVTGDNQGEYTVILEGLSEGEEVVTHGAFAIDAAAQLNNQYSMMNTNISIKKNNLNSTPDYTSETTDDFKESIHGIAEAYIQLKDAMVASDPAQAVIYSEELKTKIEAVDMTQVKGKAHDYWMDINRNFNSHLNKLSNTNDLEEERKQFEFISDLLVKSIKAFGVSRDTYYTQYCPMAFDNRGASWLSKEPEIKNPYFGDQMLKCGSVTDTLTNL